MSQHVAHVTFDLPDGATVEELAEVRAYIFEAIAAHRFSTKAPAPWKISNHTVALEHRQSRDKLPSGGPFPYNFFDAPVDPFVFYFQNLGYQVLWDFSELGKWYELYEDKELLLQIDMDAPLVHVLQDLPLLADGKPGKSESKWQVRGSLANLRKVADRIKAAQ